MNLHISPDEKFYDFVIESVHCLNLSSTNEFIVYSKNNVPIKYVKSNNVKVIDLNSKEWLTLFKTEIVKYKRIYFHYLSDDVYEILSLIPKNIKVIWLFFGAEGFSLINPNFFLQSESKKISEIASKKKYGKFYKLIFPLLYLNRIRFYEKRRKNNSKYLRRVDFFGHFLIEDYELIKKKCRANFKYLEFSFDSVEQMLAGQNEVKLGNSILIGNSATITNNHLEIFKTLSNYNLDGVKIFCPLSYGDKDYAELVERKGTELYGSNFIALREFLSLDNYNKIIADCGVVIMNHDRSQSGDNMVMALHNGAKLFLSEKSPFFNKFKNLGIQVFSIQRDINSIDDIIIPLSEEVKFNNKRIVLDYFGEEKHRERLINTLSI